MHSAKDAWQYRPTVWLGIGVDVETSNKASEATFKKPLPPVS